MSGFVESMRELDIDVEYPSPSTAGSVVHGTPTSGWDFWKTADGKSLNEATGRNRNRR